MEKIHKSSYYDRICKIIKLVNREIRKGFYNVFKVIIDILLTIIGLIIGIPLIIIFGVAIALESKGGVFYSQERVGKDGKIFKIYKLRSMVCNAEENGAQWAINNDPRITKVGGFIRKKRIDEIPQLFNVIKGDMSIIGPRPERPTFTEEFNKEISGFINRLQIKPGITGWAQVNGGYEITPIEKWELDMYYIENKSIKLDLLIIFKTIEIVLTGVGAR